MPIADAVLARVPMLRQLRAQFYAQHFESFCQAAWSTVFPGHKLHWSPALDLLCETLTATSQRCSGYLRVLWAQPVRTGKSFIANICYPVWVLLNDPSHQFVCCSYSLDLAIQHNVARRNLITSAWFTRLWPGRVELSGDRNRLDHFTTSAGGQCLVASPGSRLLGFGYSTAIVDDLLDADGALSDATRQARHVWVDSTLRTRMNDPSTAALVCISQRLHEDDVTGHMLTQEPGVWTHISVPLLCEDPTEYTFPITGRIWRRPAGDVLMPKRFPPKVIAELQQRRLVWAGQYQQSPLCLDGNMVRVSDLRYHSGVDPHTHEPDEQLPERFDYIVLGVDCAFRNYSDSDFTAICVVGVRGPKRFVVNVINQHFDCGQMEQAIRAQLQLWGPRGPVRGVVIESAASGIAISQRLKVNVGVPVIESPTAGGKVARFAAMSPEWQGHLWLLDRNASWTEFTRLQLLSFPRSRNDDICDGLAHAAQFIATQNIYSDEPLVAVLRQDRIDAARALVHPVTGYERGTAAQGSWNVSPEVGRKMTDGRGLLDMTETEIDQVLFGNLEGRE
jgi:predicted phage terminase large subunit-like protein